MSDGAMRGPVCDDVVDVGYGPTGRDAGRPGAVQLVELVDGQAGPIDIESSQSATGDYRFSAKRSAYHRTASSNLSTK